MSQPLHIDFLCEHAAAICAALPPIAASTSDKDLVRQVSDRSATLLPRTLDKWFPSQGDRRREDFAALARDAVEMVIDRRYTERNNALQLARGGSK